MSMRVDQSFMEDYVINPMAKRIADLEKLIKKNEKKLNIIQQSLNYNKKYIDENNKMLKKKVK